MVSVSREERAFRKRVKCPGCRDIVLSSDTELGMRLCRCGEQWWAVKPGWWRNWDSDAVFHLGEYKGSLRESVFDVVYGEILHA